MSYKVLLSIHFMNCRETIPLSLSGGMRATVSRITRFGHPCPPETPYDHKGVSR